MFDYEKFKAASYRYKYETALENPNERISYGQLLDMIDTVYNSVCVTNQSGGKIAVLLRNCPQAVCTYFACARAGFDCISADSMLTENQAEALTKQYGPSVVVMPSDQLSRLAGIFQENGCNIAVYTGPEPQSRYFPAQFAFDVLLDKNNYPLVEKKHQSRAGCHIFCYGSQYKDSLPERLLSLEQRRSVYIGLPIYEKAGADLLCELLYSGHRCFITESLDIKILKRKKVCAAVCDRLTAINFEDGGKPEVFTVQTDPDREFVYAGFGILYPSRVSKELSELTGRHVSCDFDGRKIRISIQTDKNPDPSDELVKLISNRCKQLLYGLNVPKSLVFEVKTV